jgi:transglutaminase-like putative cysteine protease
MGKVLPLAIIVILAASVVISAGLCALLLLTLPGLRLLPKARRVTLEGITTIDDAVVACRRTGLSGWPLAAYAQQLAARKFSYSRRNPWDSPDRAFERGLGYCQQQALALKRIYAGLGLKAQPVYAFRCRFPPAVIDGMPEPERLSPHTWLQVRIGGEVRDVCCGSTSNTPGVVHFEVLSEVKPLAPWLRSFSHLGSVIENVKRDRRACRRAQRKQTITDRI